MRDLVDISLPRRGAHDRDHDEEEEEEEKPKPKAKKTKAASSVAKNGETAAKNSKAKATNGKTKATTNGKSKASAAEKMVNEADISSDSDSDDSDDEPLATKKKTFPSDEGDEHVLSRPRVCLAMCEIGNGNPKLQE